MMTTLPPPIARYLDAANGHDADAVAACFSATGEVRDEGKLHQGRTAIRAWSGQTSADYAVTNTVLAYVPTTDGGIVTAQVKGNFPGSPLPLYFHFTLGASAIDALEITA